MTTELDWRRRWKPDLKASPWQPFRIQGNFYLIKSCFHTDGYDILITDLTSIWRESLESNAIIKRSKNLNPSVEAPLRKLLEHLRSHIEEVKPKVEYCMESVKNNDGINVILTVNTVLASLPFVWKYQANKVPNETITEHLTGPLLGMVAELWRRQTELAKILCSKDRQIDDYKSQGVKVSRKHLETVPFDEVAFTNEMSVSKGFELQAMAMEESAFSEAGQELYKSLMTKRAWLSRPPQEVVEGESLEDEGTAVPSKGTTLSWDNKLPPSLLKGTSPRVSPNKSPGRSSGNPSPSKSASSPESSPSKNTELLRRQALQRKLAEEEAKKTEKAAKKRKKFKL